MSVFPKGIIFFFHGFAAAIPSDWALCNGQNGTPDLRDRFIVGAGDSYAPGETGGAKTHTHTGKADSATVGNSVDGTTLTTAQIPSHNHGIDVRDAANMVIGGEFRGSNSSGGSATKSFIATGGGKSHTHTLSVAAHGHNMAIDDTSNLVPYYTLANIMKL